MPTKKPKINVRRLSFLAPPMALGLQPTHRRHSHSFSLPPISPKTDADFEALEQAKVKRERKAAAKELQRARSIQGACKHKWVLTDFHTAECSCGATMEG